MGFKECLNEVLKEEGTYSNHKNDSGKETYKGISRKYHPKWAGWEIVDMVKSENNGIATLKSGDITPVLGSAYNQKLNQLVGLFYKKEFWDRVSGDEIMKIDNDLACEVFDMAVNMGVKKAIKNLQKVINVVYQNYIDAKVSIYEDGILGDITKKRLKELADYDLKMDLIEYFRKYRALYYAEIVAHNPSQAVFIKGWIKRALKIS